MQVPGPRPPKMSLFGRLGGLLGRLGGLLGCLGGHLGADLRSTWGPGASENSVFRRVFADFHTFSRFDENQQKPNGKLQFSVVPGPKFHPKSAPNRSKISFRGVLGPQERPQTPRDPSQDPPRTPRDPPGTPPGPPGTPSRRPQGPPGTAQDPPKDSPRPPGASREAPRSPPGRPRELPGSPPGFPGTPQEPPRPPPDLRDPPRPFQNC